MRKSICCLCLSLISFSHAMMGSSNCQGALPYLIPTAVVEPGKNLGTFTVYRDDDANQKTLYVEPRSLRIATTESGKPKVRVFMVRDLPNAPDAAPGNATAWGFMVLSVKLGYDNQDSVFKAIKENLQQSNSAYKDYTLSTLPLRPGSGELGVELIQPNANSPQVVWMPYGATTTIGSEMTIQLPISKEMAEVIRQQCIKGDAVTSDLGVKVLYHANASFAAKEAKISVQGNATQAYKYFHEKIAGGGGFWIFSFSYQKETIREDFKKSQTLNSTIDFGDPEFTEEVKKHFKLEELLKNYEDDAIEYLMDIQVDRSGKVPDNTWQRRPGRITLFSPFTYWSFSAYLGGSYGKTEIERNSSGNYSRSLTVKGDLIKQVRMEQDNVAIPSSAFTLVDLNKAAYVSEQLVASPFQIPSEYGATVFPKYVTTARITAYHPGADGDKIVFHFDQTKPDAQSQIYFRDAVPKLVDGKYVLSTDPLEIEAEVKGPGYELSVPRGKLERTTNRFTPNRISLSDFFDTIVVDGSLYFEGVPANKSINLLVEITGQPEGSVPAKTFRLTRAAPIGVLPLGRKGENRAITAKARKLDSSASYAWGPERKLAKGQSEFILTASDLSDKTE